MKKILSLVLVISLCITMMTGCSSTFKDVDKSENSSNVNSNSNSDENKQISTKTELRYVNSSQPVSIDASTCYDAEGGQVLYNTLEGLLRFYNGQVNEGIAKEWKISDDRLTYTFYLRDAVWEDGEPVTANDFEYSAKRFLSPETASATASTMYMIKNSSAYNTGAITDWSEVGVKAIDEKTLEIKLDYVVPYFLEALAANVNLYPLREDFVNKCGSNYATNAENYISNGPFKLEYYNADTEVRYIKNEKYWNADSVKLERIEMVVSMDANTNIAMFENGEVDWYYSFDPAKFPDYEMTEKRSKGVLQYLLFNNKGMTDESAKLTSNANFRKALSYAFDRESFLKALQGEKTMTSRPADRLVEEYFTGLDNQGSFVEDFPYEGVTYNPELAKEYLNKALAELGYNSVDDLPQLTFLLFEVPVHRTYGEALLDAWKKNLGLTNIVTTQQPIPTAIQGLMTGQFDLYFQAMSLDVDPSIHLEMWKSDSGMNFSYWNDSEYDKLFASSISAKTENERLKILAECEKYLLEKAPIEPLFFQGDTAGLMVDGLENINFSAKVSSIDYIFAYFTK